MAEDPEDKRQMKLVDSKLSKSTKGVLIKVYYFILFAKPIICMAIIYYQSGGQIRPDFTIKSNNSYDALNPPSIGSEDY